MSALYGDFFDKLEITKLRPQVVTDVLRRVPGMTVIPSPDGNDRIRSSRSIRNCAPLLVLNGARVASADDVNWMLSPDVIIGIEVYQGAQIPMEFNQTGSACGVVVIWTQ